MKTEMLEYLKGELGEIYAGIKDRIILRIDEFKEVWEKGTDEDIFHELVFCLLTPGTRARSAWSALERLRHKNLLFLGEPGDIARELNIVRFRNKKALFIVHARDQFFGNGNVSLKETLQDIPAGKLKREWLISVVRGFWYKESSHFLRNIGLADGIAILDRHILRNLWRAGIIDEVPASLSKRRYISIEEKMAELSRATEIPLDHLDFVFWYKETGEIFK